MPNVGISLELPSWGSECEDPPKIGISCRKLVRLCYYYLVDLVQLLGFHWVGLAVVVASHVMAVVVVGLSLARLPYLRLENRWRLLSHWWLKICEATRVWIIGWVWVKGCVVYHFRRLHRLFGCFLFCCPLCVDLQSDGTPICCMVCLLFMKYAVVWSYLSGLVVWLRWAIVSPSSSSIVPTSMVVIEVRILCANLLLWSSSDPQYFSSSTNRASIIFYGFLDSFEAVGPRLSRIMQANMAILSATCGV